MARKPGCCARGCRPRMRKGGIPIIVYIYIPVYAKILSQVQAYICFSITLYSWFTAGIQDTICFNSF